MRSDKIPFRQLAHKLAALEPNDPVRRKHEALMLEKLYDMGILGTDGAGGRGKLSEVENKVTVSSMCRRRLGVVMNRLKMADTVQAVSASESTLLLDSSSVADFFPQRPISSLNKGMYELAQRSSRTRLS